tara:strand:- start:90600 stop:91898 length:1299 start_codon:yes stop_codon:yes gene_type:complete
MPSDSFRFIHAADLHIDSPLRGLEAYEGAPVERLRRATRDAFENLIKLAIEEDVAFVVIAGDLFDGKWQNMETGLWTARQFRQLAQRGIPVFLLRGNHDAESKVRQAVSWPSNVFEFSTRQPQTFLSEKVGLPDSVRVALHGQGFARAEVKDDLAATYPDAVPERFNIGVLHTSLTGHPAHNPYAATSLDVLRGRGYDYWALGHIHLRETHCEEPYVAFSGNTQGRHINECDAKGCLLVTVNEAAIESVEFRPLDTARWHRKAITLGTDDGLPELYDRVRESIETFRSVDTEDDDRLSVIRFEISGACTAHQALSQSVTLHEAVHEIRNIANEWEDDVWIEKIQFQTSPPIDLEQLRQSSDLVGELLRNIELLAQDHDALTAIANELTPLREKSGASSELLEAGVDLTDSDLLVRWLRQAESFLLARIGDGA